MESSLKVEAKNVVKGNLGDNLGENKVYKENTVDDKMRSDT